MTRCTRSANSSAPCRRSSCASVKPRRSCGGSTRRLPSTRTRSRQGAPNPHQLRCRAAGRRADTSANAARPGGGAGAGRGDRAGSRGSTRARAGAAEGAEGRTPLGHGRVRRHRGIDCERLRRALSGSTPGATRCGRWRRGRTRCRSSRRGRPSSGSAISDDRRADAGRDRVERVEIEAVDARRGVAEHRADLGLRCVGERRAQRFAAVGVRAFGVRVVAAPHDVVDADVVAERRLDGPDEARADVAVALEVLARREAELGHRFAAEVRLGGGRDAHALGEPVEVLQRARHPARALLGEHELQVRMAFEHTREDQGPQRAVRVDRDLDEHHRARRRIGEVERRGARPRCGGSRRDRALRSGAHSGS